MLYQRDVTELSLSRRDVYDKMHFFLKKSQKSKMFVPPPLRRILRMYQRQSRSYPKTVNIAFGDMLMSGNMTDKFGSDGSQH